jgi:hypothetical protein
MHEPFRKERKAHNYNAITERIISREKGTLDHLMQMVEVLDKNLQCGKLLTNSLLQ